MKNGHRPPSHLSTEARRIWREIVSEYAVDDAAGLRILRVSCEAFDRAQAARTTIDRDGLTVADRHGQVRPHPLIPCERDARAAFLSGLKALQLDWEPVKAIGRPPGR